MFTTKPFGEGTGSVSASCTISSPSDFSGTIEVDTEVGRGTTIHALASRERRESMTRKTEDRVCPATPSSSPTTTSITSKSRGGCSSARGTTCSSRAAAPRRSAVLRASKIDLLLLDYYMPGMTGEEVVTELRHFNPYVQIILQTGYASEQPPRELLRRLDIQGYYDKSEGPDKLLLWTEVGLKSAYVIQLLNKSRQGLRYILDVTPDMHKIQSLADLLQGILLQVRGPARGGELVSALLPEGSVRWCRPTGRGLSWR